MGIKITNLPSTTVNEADYIPVASTTNGTRKVLMQDVLDSANVNVDAAMDLTSTNPVQNKVVAAAINVLSSEIVGIRVSGTTLVITTGLVDANEVNY